MVPDLWSSNYPAPQYVRATPGLLSSNKLKQVIYTRGAQANSAFHPFGIGK